MKKTLVTSLAALVSFLQAHAANINLLWDQNPETDLFSYVVGYSNTANEYTNTVTVAFPITSATITNLTPGLTYHFAVKAVNVYALESVWSVPVSYTVPRVAPIRPRNLRINVIP
jgi:hypothetical protein